MGLARWLLAMHLLTQSKNNVAALELMRHLGVCYKTAWLVKHKLMEVMREREDSRVLDGRVEMDDAYLGGELAGGKPGRGSENKVSFIAAVQTTRDGHPQFACFALQPFTTEGVGAFAAKSLAPSATVVSDGLGCFRGVTLIGADHEPTVTGGSAASSKLPLSVSLHAVTFELSFGTVLRVERRSLRQLCRYIFFCPAPANEPVQCNVAGEVVLKLKTPGASASRTW